MTTKKKATTDAQGPFYEPYKRYKTVAYIEDDAPEGAAPFEITMRSDLTMEEVEEILPSMNEGMTNEEWRERLAPHVVAWPFRDVRTGEPVDPPSVGGGQQFKKVPMGIQNLIFNDLITVNMGRLDPKASKAPTGSGSTPGDKN